MGPPSLGNDAQEYCQRTTTNGCVDGGDRASDNDKVEEDSDGSGVEGHRRLAIGQPCRRSSGGQRR